MTSRRPSSHKVSGVVAAPGPSPRPLLIALGATLLAGAILVLHAWHFMPFVEDDALISLRYAKRLLEGHGLTWTDGPRVEGYSNLLWILLAAGLGALKIDLVLTVRMLGFACMGAALAAVVQFGASGGGAAGVVAGFGGALALSLTGTIALWTKQGTHATYCLITSGNKGTHDPKMTPEARS